MVRDEAPLDRLDRHAVPLATANPSAGLDDLRPLADAFEDARIVGMGEATHGTREFFQLKHRVLRLLVEELGVRLFGLEANFAETLAINDYVLRGEGDPVNALKGIYFWTWNTEEVLALVEWLREYNEGRDEGERVNFYGFDAQYTAGAAEAVERYLRDVDPEFLESERETVEMLANEGLQTDEGDVDDDDEVIESRLDATDALVSALEDRFHDRKATYVSETSESEWELARRHVRTMAQAAEQQRALSREDIEAKVEARDAHMAENVSWILDHESADRIGLWAHNAHVKEREARGHWGSVETMGELLGREYGEEYYALGFEFGAGSFQACPDPDDGEESGLQEFTIAEPFEGGVADTLAKLDQPCFFLDFESAAEDSRVAEWLTGDHRRHAIGAFFYDDPEKNRRRYALADELDGLLYVDETSRAVPIGGGS